VTAIDRFVMPGAGSPARIAFPPIVRSTLSNQAQVWSIQHDSVPVVTIVLMVPAGSAHDPASLPGMAGVMADLLDEGTEAHDAIGLAEALASLGTELQIDVASDVTTFTLSTLSRFMEPALALLGDVIMRPRLREDDLLSVMRASDVPVVLLEAAARSRRWSENYNVRLELVLQARTPLAVALAQITSLVPRDLARVSRARGLRPLLRAAALRAAEGRDAPSDEASHEGSGR